jgi:hypothetical protein
MCDGQGNKETTQYTEVKKKQHVDNIRKEGRHYIIKVEGK